ncbi:hypothetical protein [Clostridium sp. CTA-6]|nr:hypothetical protein [Clostridium botulinum]EKS4395699.1 hypothetical protein [Clostridium botulinum]
MINCNECQFINITEENQIDRSIDHKCLKYNAKIIHKSSKPHIKHNYIFPCKQCGGQDFIKGEEQRYND